MPVLGDRHEVLDPHAELPSRYTPGSTETTFPGTSTCSERWVSRGSSWIFIPTPCPSPWPKWSA